MSPALPTNGHASFPPAGAAPPHSIEAEQSVLGAILLSEKVHYAYVIETGLRPDDFYIPRHRAVYETMLALYNESEPIDVLTVTEHLRSRGVLDDAGGQRAIDSLTAAVPAVGNLRRYGEIVKEHSLLRKVLGAAYAIQASVHNHDAAPREIVEQAERAMLEVGQDDRKKDFRRIEDVLHFELERLQQQSAEGSAITGTASGFNDLDAITGGFQPGNLIVIAARPAMGKSCLVTNIAENAALKDGRAVALFSLEMSEAELAQRFIASQARIKGDDLRKGRVDAARWPKILDASRALGAAPLFVDDSSDTGLLELRAKSRRLHGQQAVGLGLVIVDYLQLMRTDARVESRVEQIGQISRGLKILARELDVPVIALSQLNRSVEQRHDKKPVLSDLRESGCITGDSLVYLPHTGGRIPIRDLVGRQGVRVLALDPETQRLEPRLVQRAFPSGVKPVLRLTTRTGRTLRASANHRFLTPSGWRRLDELEPGARVALPRRLPGPAAGSVSRSGPALRVHLLGDRSALPRRAIRNATNDRRPAHVVATPATDVLGAAVRPRLGAARAGYEERVSLDVDAAIPAATVAGRDRDRTAGRREALAASDVYWDPIDAIEHAGVEEVYDLTVEGLHNFVAGDIVVHNSIEQDADLVVFIYRDEYYDADSERQGEADLIIAKHRNGAVGEVTLTFAKEYPKFMNYAGERYQ